MRKAILSDVHGNLEALRYVLDDLRGQAVDEVICLGDTFGFKPGRAATDLACLDLVMEHADLTLLGNLELAAILNDKDENAGEVYQALCENTPENVRRWEFLNGLGRIYTQKSDGTMFFHGSPRSPLYGYLGRIGIYNPTAIAYEFRLIHYLGIHGHTHCQEVVRSRRKSPSERTANDLDRAFEEFLPNGGGELEWFFEKRADAEPKVKYFIGVGSVGEPRQDEQKMGYAIFEETDAGYRLCFRQFEL